MPNYIKISRKELYERVWGEPMSRLARHFGLSDVGMAKLCRRHDIPRPPRGYWARQQNGQTVRRTPLPHADRQYDIELRDPSECDVTSPILRERVEAAVELEQQRQVPIAVAETLRGAHELVSCANQEFQNAGTDEVGFLTLPEKATLAVHVSRKALHRALRIVDALLKALEARGYPVAAGPAAQILDTKVHFEIVEQTDNQQEAAAPPDLDGRYVFGHSRFRQTRVPSGRLVLRISGADTYWAQGCRRSWRDGEKQQLEHCLHKVLAGLVTFAARCREYELEQERKAEQAKEEQRRREEAARQRVLKREQYQAEQARVDNLLREARAWKESQDLRQYIETVVRHQAQKVGAVEPASEFAQWLEWAKQQADRLDPLADSPPSILDMDPAELEEPKPRWYGL